MNGDKHVTGKCVLLMVSLGSCGRTLALDASTRGCGANEGTCVHAPFNPSPNQGQWLVL